MSIYYIHSKIGLSYMKFLKGLNLNGLRKSSEIFFSCVEAAVEASKYLFLKRWLWEIILASFCCIRNISKTCSLNQALCNKLMVLQVCRLGWDQMIGSSDLDRDWLISVGFAQASAVSCWVSCGFSGLGWPRQGVPTAEAPLPVASEPGSYLDKASTPLPFIFNLPMSLNSFCNFFNLCHIRTCSRVTSLDLVAWIFLRQGIEGERQHFFGLILITFRVIIFVSFMAISPKCFQEGNTVQTKLIDWLIRWSND